jgi:sporulation protein YlmC with PRC-barrel domain
MKNRLVICLILGLMILSLVIVIGDSFTEIDFSGFESGEQGWVDGGTDSFRSSTRSNVTDTGVPGGEWSWRLQDDTTSSFVEKSFNFTGYDAVNITWAAYYDSIEVSEALELLCDGTVLWHYEANTLGTENIWLGPSEDQYITIYPANCTFDSSVTIRFESEFGQNNDNVHIDGINVTGITASAVDDEYPVFSNFEESPLNGTSYSFRDVYEFNSSILFTNGSAGIEFDDVNYSASNISDEFNVSFSSLSAGVYNYYWFSFGNGSSNNYNISSVRSYTIEKAVPEGNLTNLTGLSLVYPEQITIGLEESNEGDGDVSYVVFRDGIDVGSGETVTLGVGSYNYVLNSTGGLNYSVNESMDEFTVTVGQNSSYGLNLTINPSASVAYGTETNATGFSCPSELSCVLYRDGLNVSNSDIVTLGAGSYNYTYNTTGNANYSSKSVSEILIVNKVSPNLTYYLNSGIENVTIVFGIELNASAYTDAGILGVFRDGVSAASENGLNVTLGAGYYEYKFNVTGNENYTDVAGEFLYANITKAGSEVNLTLNSSEGNITIDQGESILLNGTLITGDSSGVLRLYNNGSLINSGAGEVSNLTTFGSLGLFNITVSYAESENYTSGSVTYYVEVLTAVDSAAPDVSIISPGNLTYNMNDLPLEFNVSLNENGSVMYSLDNGLNNVSMSSLDNRNFNSSNGSIADGGYVFQVYSNDSAGNRNYSESVVFSVDTLVPGLVIESPGNLTYRNGTILVNLTSSGDNVWFFNGTGNESYSGEVYREYSEGGYELIAYANDSVGNLNNTEVSFSVVILDLICEAGGPYQENALVLVQGNISNSSGVLDEQSVNLSVLKNGLINVSKMVVSADDGSFESSLSGLGAGSFVLNVTSNYGGLEWSCSDSIELGGPASLVLDKIAGIHNLSDSEIYYNISLRLTNKGGVSATGSNISDADSDGVFIIGDIGANESVLKSYLINLSRQNATSNFLTAVAVGRGIDAFSGELLEVNSTRINLTIPSKSIGKQIVIVKNVEFLSEESLNVSYNISVNLYNSGDEDLVNVVYSDSDISGSSILVNLTKGASKEYSNLAVVDKAASNTVHEFALGSAVIDALSFNSNRPKVSVPGYGGPADLILEAPESVSAGGVISVIIDIKNVNPDIGQDFVLDYWITSNDENVNYSSGEQTLFVGANSTVSASASLTAPGSEGVYKMKAIVAWVAGTASAFDSFVVTGVEEPSTEGGVGGVGGGESGESEGVGSGVSEGFPSASPEIELPEEGLPEGPIERPEEGSIARITGFFINPQGEGVRIIGVILLLVLTLVFIFYIFKKKGKKILGRASSLKGMLVFSADGMKVGKVKEIKIGEHRIDSLKIRISRKVKRRVRGIIVNYKDVENVGDVVIVDRRVFEKL